MQKLTGGMEPAPPPSQAIPRQARSLSYSASPKLVPRSRPAEPALSWITLRIREALRGGRHEREIGTKRYCRTLLGPKIYWIKNLSDDNPTTELRSAEKI